jgi:hypothetical protein
MPRRVLVGRVTSVLVAVALLVGLVAKVAATHEDRPAGLVLRSAGVAPGYTLYAPIELQAAYLVDLDGEVVHEWPTTTQPGLGEQLLPNGHLLRAGDLKAGGTYADGQGAGGRVEELDWDGNLVWRFDYANDEVMQHHDVTSLPNGNVLLVAWERVSKSEAIANGRDPSSVPEGELWPDTIVEYSPAQRRIVWKWRVWDHLVQNRDPSKRNYGDPADHPEKIDLNFLIDPENGQADWNHVNAVFYDAKRDEVMISSRSFSEIWIVDHSTTTTEAAGPAGDLQFRFGNPQTYGRGTPRDQQLFVQHDPVRISDGAPGAGRILVFSNGTARVRPYSTIEEIEPVVDARGDYVLGADGRFAATMRRVYPERARDRFFAAIISSAQRLPNGNTFICYGNYGRMIEVTPAGETVWEYENPRFRRHADTPKRTGTGFVIEPWWTFRAYKYAPDYPGLSRLAGRQDQTSL